MKKLISRETHVTWIKTLRHHLSPIKLAWIFLKLILSVREFPCLLERALIYKTFCKGIGQSFAKALKKGHIPLRVSRVYLQPRTCLWIPVRHPTACHSTAPLGYLTSASNTPCPKPHSRFLLPLCAPKLFLLLSSPSQEMVTSFLLLRPKTLMASLTSFTYRQ